MPLLSASSLRVGAAAVDRVYLGAVQVWTPPAAEPLGVLSGLDWGSGAYTMHDDANRVALESSRRRPVDVLVVYPQRDTWLTIMNTFWLTAHTNFTGRLSVTMPLIPGTEGTIADAATGAYDQKWKDFATLLANNGRSDSVVRLGWEMNLHANLRYSCLVGEEANWREAYRRAVTAMRTVIPGMGIDWCPNAGSSATGTVVNPYPDAYPGDAYVSFIGCDSYNWYPVVTTASEWPGHRDKGRGLTYYLDLAKSLGKRFSLAEWGVYPGTAGFPESDAAVYITEMHNWFAANSADIGYEAYFNESAAYYAGAVEPPTAPNASAEYMRLWTPTDTTLGVPTLTATVVSDTRIDWSHDAAAGAATYDRERGGVVTSGHTTTAWSDTGLTAGTAYTYRVRAVSSTGTVGAWSASVTATTNPAASTVIFTETWTGADGAAWPAQWAEGMTPAGGGASIVGNAGQLATGNTGGYFGNDRVSRRYTSALLDADATFRFRYVTGESYPRACFRSNNSLDGGAGYLLEMQTDGYFWRAHQAYASTSLGAKVAYALTSGTWYRVRARVVGNVLQARIWADGTAEPSTWPAGTNITDTTITTAGAFGFSIGSGNAASSSTVQVDDLTVT